MSTQDECTNRTGIGSTACQSGIRITISNIKPTAK